MGRRASGFDPRLKNMLRMVGIHPVVHKRLRIKAAEADLTIQEAIHEILCSQFGIEVDFNQLPETELAEAAS